MSSAGAVESGRVLQPEPAHDDAIKNAKICDNATRPTQLENNVLNSLGFGLCQRRLTGFTKPITSILSANPSHRSLPFLLKD